MIHGDDFVSSGSSSSLKWFKEVLEARFEIKTEVVGLGSEEVREARILNRVIRVDENGWEYEADQRHGEMIIKSLEMTNAKGVSTPGGDEQPWKEQEHAEKLGHHEGRQYRSLVARANYLSPDRPDIQYAVKELCRSMSDPSRGDMASLRRLARYLIDRPRLIWRFDMQDNIGICRAYSDSDWAGCKRTAKSTSGGVLKIGSHTIKTWSSTQKSITLSSGEAELVAAVKTSTELIGLCQMAQEWDIELAGEVLVDSSAALGATKRKGNGKLRHVRVGLLWIQQKSEEGEIKYEKVLGTENPADLMTKHLSKNVSVYLQQKLGLTHVSGRSSVSLTI
jgi:hypothetical protein